MPLHASAAGKDRKGHSSGPDSPRSFNMSPHAPLLKACYSLQPPEELLPFVVPFAGGPGALAGGWRKTGEARRRGSAARSGAASKHPLRLWLRVGVVVVPVVFMHKGAKTPDVVLTRWLV